MIILQTRIIALWLVIFLVMGAGCAEQEQKSRETGEAIIDTLKEAEKNVNDSVLKMQAKTDQLVEVDK